MTLEEVVHRLSSHSAVEGLLLSGSAGHGKVITPASDYDVLVVLSLMPLPLQLGLTYIDHRLTECGFISAELLDQLLDNTFDRTQINWWVRGLIGHLQKGTVVFDRSGRLQQVQNLLQTGAWLPPIAEQERYATWWEVNYELKHIKRMLLSPDPVYLLSVDFSLLRALSDLFKAYFRLRGVLYPGDKEALRYLEAHDQPYLVLFQQCLAEPERARKVHLYEQVASLTLAPVGGLWEKEVTSIALDDEDEFHPETVHAALSFWESLLGAEAALPAESADPTTRVSPVARVDE
jgi:hypothetical protein